MEREPQCYVYKMTTDNGGAPCVMDGLLTLAICKPGIRSTAATNDWLFGFGGEDLGGRLIYIAKVTGKMTDGDYYRPEARAGRPDQIYKWDGDRLRWRRGARYHHNGCEEARDVGGYPDYRRANVLFSSAGSFRYLGDKGEVIDPKVYPESTRLLAGLKQGHRVHDYPQELQDELAALWDEVFVRYRRSVVGKPSHGDFKPSCSRIEGGVSVCGGSVRALDPEE